MVRKIKMSNVIESQETPQAQETPNTTPETEVHVNTPTEPEVVIFETTPEIEPPPDAANAKSAATAVEPTPKPARTP